MKEKLVSFSNETRANIKLWPNVRTIKQVKLRRKS